MTDRCPTCDKPMTGDEEADDDVFCVRYKPRCMNPTPVDWRARALALTAQRDRMLRVCQAARLFVEGGAPHFAALATAVRDAVARADSRSIAVRLAEAEEMAARLAALAVRLRATVDETAAP